VSLKPPAAHSLERIDKVRLQFCVCIPLAGDRALRLDSGFRLNPYCRKYDEGPSEFFGWHSVVVQEARAPQIRINRDAAKPPTDFVLESKLSWLETALDIE
jgi:hypothetical protein